MHMRRLDKKLDEKKGALVVSPMDVFARALKSNDVLRDFGHETTVSLSELGLQIPIGQAEGGEIQALKPIVMYRSLSCTFFWV